MSTDGADVELRGNTPRTVVAVIDAVSTARRLTRMELVNKILAEWAEQQQAEAVAIERCLRGMETKR